MVYFVKDFKFKKKYKLISNMYKLIKLILLIWIYYVRIFLYFMDCKYVKYDMERYILDIFFVILEEWSNIIKNN